MKRHLQFHIFFTTILFFKCSISFSQFGISENIFRVDNNKTIKQSFIMDFDGDVDWIITNPPWSRLRHFLAKAMSTADNIVFLSAFIHYGTKARMADLRKYRYGWRSFVMVPEPKLNWPQSGFQLGAAHLQRDWEGPCQFIDRIETWKETAEV